MKQLIVCIFVVAMMASCGNRKNHFDYSTLPAKWIKLSLIDEYECVVYDDSDVLTITDNKLTLWYLSVGEKWVHEILSAHQTGDTIIFRVKSSDDFQRDFKFIWSNKASGIAVWIFDKNDSGAFVSDEMRSAFPEISSRYEDEDDDEDDNDYDEDEATSLQVATQSTNPENLIRPDETIYETVSGDLNKDGKDDCVIITKQTKKRLTSVKNQFGDRVDRNRRGILIAFKNADDYNTVLAIPNCFLSENEDGGVYFAPELFVEVVKGNLKIHYAHGRYGFWTYLFRYQNNNFELIGYDESNNRGPVTERSVSINFLTGKMKTQRNTNPDADSGEEVFDEAWQDIEMNALVKLTDITSFEDFDISGCYTVK